MNKSFAAFLFCAVCSSATPGAPAIAFSPQAPTTVDTVVFTATGLTNPSCPILVPGSVEMLSSRTIRLRYEGIVDCDFAPFTELRTTLGRLPAGSYTVELIYGALIGTPPPVATATLIVAPLPGTVTPSAPPLDDYGGHWLTSVDGEGVFVWQYGAKTFVSFLSYGADGHPTWQVMPDARWEYDAGKGFRFAGAIYSTTRSAAPPAPGEVTATPIGTGYFYPRQFDVGAIEWTANGQLSSRTLRRFRF